MKRATIANNAENRNKVISIHALVKRATIDASANHVVLEISIHALVKRATEILSKNTKRKSVFQSTPS